jgi:myo-inositol-hexaphosphate 3-phosphohydrolase
VRRTRESRNGAVDRWNAGEAQPIQVDDAAADEFTIWVHNEVIGTAKGEP